jgi:hypothetical protein
VDHAQFVWLVAQGNNDQRVQPVEEHDVGLSGEVAKERTFGDPGLFDDLGHVVVS